MSLSYLDVRQQSRQVWAQFGESLWIPNAKENVKLERENSWNLANVGLGKNLVLAAMGASLEKDIEAIKKNRDKIDVVTCDKAFGPLLDHGVKADYVILADASILPHWLDKWVEETKGVKLLSTPYANPNWTTRWKGPKYFYVNRDAIESEKIFLEIMGKNTRTIPAGSNVSNAMLVFFVGADESNLVNFSAYERYLLTGYDYSWKPDGNYYAWNLPPFASEDSVQDYIAKWKTPKRGYMTHRTLLDLNNEVRFTSENLLFSAKWLTQYIGAFRLPVVNCSDGGILQTDLRGNMEQELARIRPGAESKENVLKAFEALKIADNNHRLALAEFSKAREEILWQ